MSVVLVAILNARPNKTTQWHAKKPKKVTLIPKLSIAASLKRALVNTSITCIIMRKEKAPMYKSSRSKAPITRQNCHYRHVRKTINLFLLHDTGASFSSRYNFANLGSFAKVSVRVGSIIPWPEQGIVYLTRNGNSATFLSTLPLAIIFKIQLPL